MTSRLFSITVLTLFLLTAGTLVAQRRGASGNNTMPTAGASDLIVHGTVVLPGGMPAGRLVTVERICAGRPREAYFADARGRFSFNLGAVDHGRLINPNDAANTAFFSSAGDMRDCVIRASLAGYHAPPLRSRISSRRRSRIWENWCCSPWASSRPSS
jgi:hypothetical protein